MKTNTYIIYSSYILVIYSLYTVFHTHFWRDGETKGDTKTRGGRTRGMLKGGVRAHRMPWSEGEGLAMRTHPSAGSTDSGFVLSCGADWVTQDQSPFPGEICVTSTPTLFRFGRPSSGISGSYSAMAGARSSQGPL